jgi:hypothetical protein
MATESYVNLKVSVWRDFVPSRAMLLRVAGEEEHRLLSGDSDLQQEVFSWQMREDRGLRRGPELVQKEAA